MLIIILFNLTSEYIQLITFFCPRAFCMDGLNFHIIGDKYSLTDDNKGIEDIVNLENNMSIMDDIMEAIYWFQIFLAPFIPLSIVGIVIYFNNTNCGWLCTLLMIVGVILGVILAERIRRKYGTTTYMGRIKGNSEFIEDKSKDKKESK
jgi:hypothetical protein